MFDCAIRILGPDRRRDAEWLADQQTRHLDAIYAAHAGILKPSAPHPDAERLMHELAEQMLKHSTQMLRTAFAALTDMFAKTLETAVHGAPKTEAPRRRLS